MSLTEAEHVFAGVHEDGINDFLQAFFTARPRHLNYGTFFFVPATTAAATNVPSVSFPGIPAGIHYAVSFAVPVVDLNPDTLGGPLPPGPGQFSLTARVTLTVGCWRFRREGPQDDPSMITPLTTELTLWARGHPTVTFFGPPGSGQIGLRVDEVEIEDIHPDSLESIVECIIRMMLEAALANLRLPFNALSAGAVKLILLRGPEIEDDQLKLYGDI